MRKAHFRIDDPTQPPGSRSSARRDLYSRERLRRPPGSRKSSSPTCIAVRRTTGLGRRSRIHRLLKAEISQPAPSSRRNVFADAAQAAVRSVALVWALDRFTRESVAETFEHIQRLTSNGVQFVSFTEEHFRTTGPAGNLIIAVAAWIVKQERARISERVRAGLDRTRTHGTRSGKPVDYDPEVIFSSRSRL